MFIAHSAPNDSKLIQAARAVNNYKPQFVFKQIKEAINRISKPTKNITISAFGLAYKPNIDDLRESPALQITENLKNLRCKQVMVIEPNIRALPDSLNDFACIEKDINQATKADILVFLVSHNEFKILKDYNFKSSIVIDACGLLVDS